MLEESFKRYFRSKISDLENRKLRVWQKIESRMLEDVADPVAEVTPAFSFNLGLKPLVLSFVLVILSGMSVNAVNSSLPGDRLFAVRKAVFEAQLKLTANQDFEEVKIALIEARALDLARLESKKESGEVLSETEVEAVEAIKHEVGEAAIALLAEAEVKEKKTVSQSANPSNEKKTVAENKPEAKAVGLVQAAEARIVGEAVTQFLRSTELTGKLKAEKLIEVAKKAKEEVQVATENQEKPADPVATSTATKTPAVSEPTKAENSSEPKSSIIEGEVDSTVEVIEE